MVNVILLICACNQLAVVNGVDAVWSVVHLVDGQYNLVVLLLDPLFFPSTVFPG